MPDPSQSEVFSPAIVLADDIPGGITKRKFPSRNNGFCEGAGTQTSIVPLSVKKSLLHVAIGMCSGTESRLSKVNYHTVMHLSDNVLPQVPPHGQGVGI